MVRAKKKVNTSSNPLILGEHSFLPGQRGVVPFEVGHLITHEKVIMPVHVIRGKLPGPRILVCAGIHGDELNGVETIRRLVKMRVLNRLQGDLIAVPVVNIPAFVARSRYLPDRRDLNRLFPGTSDGSFGARLAKQFVDHIVSQCDYGIDLHTGAINRPNLPQIRMKANCPACRQLAIAFGAPVALASELRDGSLRATMSKLKKPILMFEGGEALRLDVHSIKFSTQGILNVMRHLEMLPPEKTERKQRPVVISKESTWARAAIGGIVTPLVALGKAVTPETPLAFIADPFGASECQVYPKKEGVVIGRTNLGIADEGDGLFHIAVTSSDPNLAERRIRRSSTELNEENDHPVSDEPLLD